MSRKKLTHDEVAYFCDQFAMIINSGIPMSEGAEMIAESTENTFVSEVAKRVEKVVTDDQPLYEAMKQSGAFPDYAVSMVRIGTLSGRLDDVLKGLSEYYEQMGSRLRTIRSAVMHPVILIAMMAAIIIVLILQVLPMFQQIFGQFNSTVGDTVSASVDYAYATGIIILVILVAILVISLLVWLLSKIPSVRSGLSSFASSFILTKRTAGVFSQAKFANAMSMMISSGIEASTALENVMLLISDKKMRGRIDKCRAQVIEGESFADALDDAKLLPPIYSRSLKMSYRSGSFDDAWRKISDRCSEEADVTSENLVSFVEPVLIAVMAVIIGAILLTVMLPMMDILSTLG